MQAKLIERDPAGADQVELVEQGDETLLLHRKGQRAMRFRATQRTLHHTDLPGGLSVTICLWHAAEGKHAVQILRHGSPGKDADTVLAPSLAAAALWLEQHCQAIMAAPSVALPVAKTPKSIAAHIALFIERQQRKMLDRAVCDLAGDALAAWDDLDNKGRDVCRPM